MEAAVAYGIETTGREGSDLPIPIALLTQSRMAARVGIPLDTVLRGYFAVYSLLGYFILEEASYPRMTGGAELQRLLGAHAGIFDRLLAVIAEEYARESEALRSSSGRRQAERIERLLAGEPDTAGVPYEFDGWHVGLALGDLPEAGGALRELAAEADCCLLTLVRDERVLWAWLGSRRPTDPVDVGRAANALGLAPDLSLAIGEPAEGLAGWRLTHRQARAAIGVARRTGRSVVRYAEVAVLAAILQDDLLVTSLRRIYLVPLEGARDGGATARRTLRAYFAAARNVSSAAAGLGVSRQTVTSRLRAVEETLNRPLHECANDLDIALRTAELDPQSAA